MTYLLEIHDEQSAEYRGLRVNSNGRADQPNTTAPRPVIYFDVEAFYNSCANLEEMPVHRSYMDDNSRDNTLPERNFNRELNAYYENQLYSTITPYSGAYDTFQQRVFVPLPQRYVYPGPDHALCAENQNLETQLHVYGLQNSILNNQIDRYDYENENLKAQLRKHKDDMQQLKEKYTAKCTQLRASNETIRYLRNQLFETECRSMMEMKVDYKEELRLCQAESNNRLTRISELEEENRIYLEKASQLMREKQKLQELVTSLQQPHPHISQQDSNASRGAFDLLENYRNLYRSFEAEEAKCYELQKSLESCNRKLTLTTIKLDVKTVECRKLAQEKEQLKKCASFTHRLKKRVLKGTNRIQQLFSVF